MPYAVSSEQRVNDYTQSRQSAAQTIALPDGGYLTVWSGAGQADQGYGIYLQRFNAAGVRVGDEVLVNTTTTYSQQNPEVTVLASGGYVITWDSTVPGGQPGDPAALGIFVQTFNAAGTRVGPETQVSLAGNSQRVTALADGGYVVTWAQQVEAPFSSVLARRFDASGQALGPAWALDRDLDASVPGVVATDTGFIAVWRAYNDGGAATIAVQSFGLDGQRLGDTFHIPRDGDRTYPEIVALTDGGFALVWLETAGLYARILDDQGRPSGDRFLVGSANGAQLLHSVVATPDGGFTVAWDRFSGGGSHIVEARAFFADGRQNGETISVRNGSGSPGEPPALTTLASGEIVLTYARYVGNIAEFFDVFQVRLQPLVVTQRGSGTDDTLTGRSEGDRLMGLEGADFLLGLEGDDTLVDGRGNDILDGGAGWDEAVFAGSAASYTIFQEGAGFRVKGADGFDQLVGIELLRFDDRAIDLLRIVCDPSTGAVSFPDPPEVSLPGAGPATKSAGPQVLPPRDLHDDGPSSAGDPGMKVFDGPVVWPEIPTSRERFLFGSDRPGAVDPTLPDAGLNPPPLQVWDW